MFGVKTRLDDAAFRSLARKLADLDQKVATKAIQDGINEVTKVVLNDAKAMVPTRSKLLRKSLGRRVRVYRNSRVVVGIIGPRRGYRVEVNGRWVNPAKYAHLVEYGRGVARRWKKRLQSDLSIVYGTRQHPARSAAPKPFMRPAWANNRQRATAILLAHLRAGFRQYLAGGGTRRKAA
ncbi:MAG TPA: HK97 gp10 family phage protein [Gemmataceae bacterium]|nr:HK97 gp10 family phage protein [Gemmataceae bacterium]